MVTLLLALWLAVFEAFLPSSGTESVTGSDVGDLARMVKGRALLCLIREGMTAEQVERILGRPDCKITLGNFPTWHYWLLGVNVSFGRQTTVSHFGYYAH
jgi:outer membrane protein assembly factor BamE (lipoprotein component of BamABCDE complex)